MLEMLPPPVTRVEFSGGDFTEGQHEGATVTGLSYRARAGGEKETAGDGYSGGTGTGHVFTVIINWLIDNWRAR